MMGCNCKLSKHHDDHGVHAGQGKEEAEGKKQVTKAR
jgi:hypothetical protein